MIAGYSTKLLYQRRFGKLKLIPTVTFLRKNNIVSYLKDKHLVIFQINKVGATESM